MKPSATSARPLFSRIRRHGDFVAVMVSENLAASEREMLGRTRGPRQRGEAQHGQELSHVTHDETFLKMMPLAAGTGTGNERTPTQALEHVADEVDQSED
jgi:hypothetical protein